MQGSGPHVWNTSNFWLAVFRGVLPAASSPSPGSVWRWKTGLSSGKVCVKGQRSLAVVRTHHCSWVGHKKNHHWAFISQTGKKLRSQSQPCSTFLCSWLTQCCGVLLEKYQSTVLWLSERSSHFVLEVHISLNGVFFFSFSKLSLHSLPWCQG